MAEELSAWPVIARPHAGGRKALYPWDEWFSGKIWKLTKDVDFTCEFKSMRNYTYAMAKERGIKIRVHMIKEENALVIQAYPKE